MASAVGEAGFSVGAVRLGLARREAGGRFACPASTDLVRRAVGIGHTLFGRRPRALASDAIGLVRAAIAIGEAVDAAPLPLEEPTRGAVDIIGGQRAVQAGPGFRAGLAGGDVAVVVDEAGHALTGDRVAVAKATRTRLGARAVGQRLASSALAGLVGQAVGIAAAVGAAATRFTAILSDLAVGQRITEGQAFAGGRPARGAGGAVAVARTDVRRRLAGHWFAAADLSNRAVASGSAPIFDALVAQAQRPLVALLVGGALGGPAQLVDAYRPFLACIVRRARDPKAISIVT